jgi:uncharacterized protein YqgV (UPF0045/DUF77 family)
VLVAFSITPIGVGEGVAAEVSLVLKADLRPGVTGALTAKVEAVERHLRDPE